MQKIVTTSGRRPPRRGKLPLLIAAAVALVALAVVLNSSHVARRPSPDTPGSTPVSAPAAPVASTEARPATPDPTPTASATATAPAATPTPSNSIAAPLASAKMPAAKLSWEEAESNRLAKSEAIMLAMAPKKHFDNEVENALDSVFRPGAQFLKMPFVDMSQEEVVAFLKRPVEIFDDDDDETVAAKERTAAAKTAALKYIEGGGTINQFIRDQVNAERERQATTAEIRAEMRRVLLSDGVEAAQAYLDEVNPLLEESGCQPVKIGRGEMNLLRKQQGKEPQK